MSPRPSPPPSPRDEPGPAGPARLEWLRARLADDGAVRISVAAAELGTSAMTVRRDLATLEALGEVRRVRGGAHAVGGVRFEQRSPRNVKAKIAIAEKLVAMAPGRGTIASDSSSTMAGLANLLSSARDLIVVTNGLQAFEALQGRPGIRPVLTGGEQDPTTGSLVGPVATAAARSYRYDIAFVSSAALDVAHGACEITPDEASIVGAFAEQSRSVLLGVDSSKLEADAPVISLRWADVDAVVTELRPDNPRLAPLAQAVELR